jgi:hypothetical protein
MTELWLQVEVLINPLLFGAWSINQSSKLSQDIQAMYIYQYIFRFYINSNAI